MNERKRGKLANISLYRSQCVNVFSFDAAKKSIIPSAQRKHNWTRQEDESGEYRSIRYLRSKSIANIQQIENEKYEIRCTEIRVAIDSSQLIISV